MAAVDYFPNNDDDRNDDEETAPTSVTNAMFDVALALTFD